MSKSYPSKSRVRKAYAKGLRAGKLQHGRNVYINGRLRELWNRGFINGRRMRGV